MAHGVFDKGEKLFVTNYVHLIQRSIMRNTVLLDAITEYKSCKILTAFGDWSWRGCGCGWLWRNVLNTGTPSDHRVPGIGYQLAVVSHLD